MRECIVRSKEGGLTLVDFSERVGAWAAGNRTAEADARSQRLEHGTVDTMGNLEVEDDVLSPASSMCPHRAEHSPLLFQGPAHTKAGGARGHIRRLGSYHGHHVPASRCASEAAP